MQYHSLNLLIDTREDCCNSDENIEFRENVISDCEEILSWVAWLIQIIITLLEYV